MIRLDFVDCKLLKGLAEALLAWQRFPIDEGFERHYKVSQLLRLHF